MKALNGTAWFDAMVEAGDVPRVHTPEMIDVPLMLAEEFGHFERFKNQHHPKALPPGEDAATTGGADGDDDNEDEDDEDDESIEGDSDKANAEMVRAMGEMVSVVAEEWSITVGKVLEQTPMATAESLRRGAISEETQQLLDDMPFM